MLDKCKSLREEVENLTQKLENIEKEKENISIRNDKKLSKVDAMNNLISSIQEMSNEELESLPNKDILLQLT